MQEQSVIPFGVDLAIVQVGEGARKSNYDYTKGELDTLIEIICAFNAEERGRQAALDEQGKTKSRYRAECRLFVCAIGACPPQVVGKLHAAGIQVMNMCGS